MGSLGVRVCSEKLYTQLHGLKIALNRYLKTIKKFLKSINLICFSYLKIMLLQMLFELFMNMQLVVD